MKSANSFGVWSIAFRDGELTGEGIQECQSIYFQECGDQTKLVAAD
jgi:hypothetical protein